jgi:serine/threonine protein kinase
VQPGAAGTPDYMNARLVADPTPLTELGCEVSPQIEAIVERALRRDPNRRYPSAAEFSFDLERPDSVRIDQRECFSLKKRIMAFSTLAVIPVILLGLLIYAASRQ